MVSEAMSRARAVLTCSHWPPRWPPTTLSPGCALMCPPALHVGWPRDSLLMNSTLQKGWDITSKRRLEKPLASLLLAFSCLSCFLSCSLGRASCHVRRFALRSHVARNQCLQSTATSGLGHWADDVRKSGGGVGRSMDSDLVRWGKNCPEDPQVERAETMAPLLP